MDLKSKYSVKELLETIENCYSQLCDLNLNGIWPDPNPNWDYSYYADKETTDQEVKKYLDHLSLKWTLADVHYQDELLLVKFTEKWVEDHHKCIRESAKELSNCTFLTVEIPEWSSTSKTFYVLGEVAQHQGHFLLSECDTGKILPGEFYSYDLQILTAADEEVGMTVSINFNSNSEHGPHWMTLPCTS
jgi:hypothetical protein